MVICNLISKLIELKESYPDDKGNAVIVLVGQRKISRGLTTSIE